MTLWISGTAVMLCAWCSASGESAINHARSY